METHSAAHASPQGFQRRDLASIDHRFSEREKLGPHVPIDQQDITLFGSEASKIQAYIYSIWPKEQDQLNPVVPGYSCYRMFSIVKLNERDALESLAQAKTVFPALFAEIKQHPENYEIVDRSRNGENDAVCDFRFRPNHREVNGGSTRLVLLVYRKVFLINWSGSEQHFDFLFENECSQAVEKGKHLVDTRFPSVIS